MRDVDPTTQLDNIQELGEEEDQWEDKNNIFAEMEKKKMFSMSVALMWWSYGLHFFLGGDSEVGKGLGKVLRSWIGDEGGFGSR